MEESIIPTGIEIAIASDHTGFAFKEILKSHLANLGYKHFDYGTFNKMSTDYSKYAHVVANKIQNDEYPFAILICGSGEGMSMTANKYSKVRAALCWNEEIAEMSRKHNDANVLCLPARHIDNIDLILIVTKFLCTKFEGGRHEKRVSGIPIKTVSYLDYNGGDELESWRIHDQS